MSDLEYHEIGYAENIDFPGEDLKKRENLLEEVEVQFTQLEKERDYDPSQLSRLRQIVEDHLAAFDTKSSPSRMSH